MSSKLNVLNLLRTLVAQWQRVGTNVKEQQAEVFPRLEVRARARWVELIHGYSGFRGIYELGESLDAKKCT